MSSAASGISDRAVELRRDFDRIFAEPIRRQAPQEDLLAIRAGGQPYALRLSQIAGIFVDRKITSVPGSCAGLRGIAGFRGAILPVYDLQALLAASSAQNPRWLVVAAAAPVAFAFETFEGQLRVARSEILPQSTRSGSHAYAREYVRTEAIVRPILHLPSVLRALQTINAEQIVREE